MQSSLCSASSVTGQIYLEERNAAGGEEEKEWVFAPESDNVVIRVPYNYRKRGSASYIVREVLLVRERERYREREREREREIDGSDVTIVALKLAMNLHFPLPKNIGSAEALPILCVRYFW